jgi:hypothetical protein
VCLFPEMLVGLGHGTATPYSAEEIPPFISEDHTVFPQKSDCKSIPQKLRLMQGHLQYLGVVTREDWLCACFDTGSEPGSTVESPKEGGVRQDLS